jgi:hypothetical protein
MLNELKKSNKVNGRMEKEEGSLPLPPSAAPAPSSRAQSSMVKDSRAWPEAWLNG